MCGKPPGDLKKGKRGVVEKDNNGTGIKNKKTTEKRKRKKEVKIPFASDRNANTNKVRLSEKGRGVGGRKELG